MELFEYQGEVETRIDAAPNTTPQEMAQKSKALR